MFGTYTLHPVVSIGKDAQLLDAARAFKSSQPEYASMLDHFIQMNSMRGDIGAAALLEIGLLSKYGLSAALGAVDWVWKTISDDRVVEFGIACHFPFTVSGAAMQYGIIKWRNPYGFKKRHLEVSPGFVDVPKKVISKEQLVAVMGQVGEYLRQFGIGVSPRG